MKNINEMTIEELEITNNGLDALYTIIHGRACKLINNKEDCTGEVKSLEVILELKGEIVARYKELIGTDD